jgi:hypothetical protein
MAQGKDDVDFLSTKYLKKCNKRRSQLQGARIVAEWINENICSKTIASFV